MKIYRFFTLSFLVLTIISSCQKDHPSYEELYKKASEKYQEMNLLTQRISCEEISKSYVDTLLLNPNVKGYLPVSPTIKKQYDLLKTEHTKLLTEAMKADDRPYLNLAYLHMPAHFGIICQNGFAKVKTVEDFNTEQTRAALNERSETLQNYFKDKPCTAAGDWIITGIKKDCSQIWIPTIADQTYRNGFYIILTEYNTLYFHLTQLDKELQNCTPNSAPAPKSVRCENNKPILVF